MNLKSSFRIKLSNNFSFLSEILIGILRNLFLNRGRLLMRKGRLKLMGIRLRWWSKNLGIKIRGNFCWMKFNRSILFGGMNFVFGFSLSGRRENLNFNLKNFNLYLNLLSKSWSVRSKTLILMQFKRSSFMEIHISLFWDRKTKETQFWMK